MTPDEFTISEQMLDVGDGHQLYVHDWGNKDAKHPIMFLHGGPGGGTGDKHKLRFFPEKQRVIFFDQRGSGRSLPYGSLEENNTDKLVGDIVKILDHFHIDKIILTGGSWGSALSFFFGIAHPSRVQAMVLDGIWTCRKSENDWIDQGGFSTFMPDAWDRYLQTVPVKHRDNPTRYHFERILGDDPEAAKSSGYAYENLEHGALQLDDRIMPGDYELYDPAGIRIEVSYLVQQGYVPDNYVFTNAGKLTMPIWLVQGRYDMVCPPRTAYELSKILPNSHLLWTTSGHKMERESWNTSRAILLQLSEVA